MEKSLQRSQYIFGLIFPLLLIILILVADILEGPKTAYVGVLACVAPLAAAFGTIRMVSAVAITALAGGYSIGHFASDGNVAAQNTRLFIITLVSILAIGITRTRINTQGKILNLATELAVANALNHHANRDFLTGNLNRQGIVDLLADFDRPSRSVVMIDLDGFKSINDVYGHKIGDEYLKAVTGRISNGLKAEDIYGRWGGDEFVAAMPHDATKTTEIFRRIVSEVILMPFQSDGIEIPIEFSAGVSLWKPGSSFETALQDADKALYEAKSRGGCTVVNFAELLDLGASSKHAH